MFCGIIEQRIWDWTAKSFALSEIKMQAYAYFF